MSDVVSARLLREIFLAGFMAGLPAENVAWAASRLAGAMSDVRLRAGDVLYREGELAPDHFFVVEGEVSLETAGSPAWTLGSRSLIGTLDVTLDRPRSRTVTAVRDTHLFRVPAGDPSILRIERFGNAEFRSLQLLPPSSERQMPVLPATTMSSMFVGETTTSLWPSPRIDWFL